MEFVPHVIDGQETESISGERFASVDPWTREPWAEVALGGADALLADLIEANAEMLALADSTDMGKPVSDARTRDVPRTAANYRFSPTKPGWPPATSCRWIPATMPIPGSSPRAWSPPSRGIYAEFLDRFTAAAQALVVGNPKDPATQLGPLASQEHYKKVRSYLDGIAPDGGTSAALKAGTVWVNCFFVRDLRAPFGGAPVRSSKLRQPRAYRSALLVSGSRFQTSGAI